MSKKESLQQFPETLNELWDQAYSRIIPEMPFILWQDEKKNRIVSWKETIALGYCMAGFLLSRNITRGDTFGVFAQNNPALIYIELGGRLLGAIPVMIPYEASTKDVAEIARQTGMKMVMVSDADTYHRALAALGTNFTVKDIVTLFDDEQILVPGRTAIFDWLIDPGKSYWRENLPEIKGLKNQVQADDVCCISYEIQQDHSLKGSVDTHATLLKKFQEELTAFSSLGEAKTFMPCVPYWKLENRLKGYYLPLQFNMQIIFPHGNSSIENALRSLKPEVMLVSSAQLNGLFDRLKGKISLKGWMGKRNYTKALKTGLQYYQTLDSQTKPGFLLAWRFKRARQRIRQGLIKPLNPLLKYILLSDEGLSLEACTFFLQADIPIYTNSGTLITAENRKQFVTMTPASTPFVIKKMPETEPVPEVSEFPVQ